MPPIADRSLKQLLALCSAFNSPRPQQNISTDESMAATGTTSPAISKVESFLQLYGSTVFGQVLFLGFGVLTGIMSARMLGPVGRGEYAALNVWPLGIALLLTLGINQGIAFQVRRRVFSVSEVATAATVIGLVSSALSVAIGLLVVPVVLSKYTPEVRHLGIVFVLFTPTVMLSGYPAGVFQGLQDLRHFNLIRLLAPGAYCAGLAGLYLTHHWSLRALIYAQAFGYLLALCAGLFMVLRFVRPRLKWNPAALSALVHYGVRIQMTNLTNYFNQRIDQLVLSLLVPPRELGLYAVAVTLSATVSVVPTAAGIVTFSKASGQEPEHARRMIGQSFRTALAWLLVCCGLLFVAAPFLIHFVFGTAFDGSILACRILLPGALVTGLNQVLYSGASALGRPGLPSIAECVSMAVTAVGLYLLIPRYGYIGAATVSTIAYSISFLLMLGLAHRILGLRIRDLLDGRESA
jgi:O-antigen/teichoic acid export membrane protein